MIVVTGGTGYIGSHTVVELLANGREVVILDDLSNSDISIIDSISVISGVRPEFHCVDLTNAIELHKVFDQIGKRATAVIHFAAKKAVGESVQRPLEYYRNNIHSLINVMSEMDRFAISSLVFSSSCTVYGQPDEFPVTEKTPRKAAESPYGNTKSICEDIIRDTSKASNSRSISLRYFNPIGAHVSGLIGELPSGAPNNLVPYVTQTAAGIRQELTIFGGDYPTADGTCIRDYINVVDLAKAHIRALERLENEKCDSNYEVFNIGTGSGFSVLEVVRAFEAATGVPVRYKIGERRAGDITEIYADTQLANTVLNWKAEICLEDSLRSAWNWEQNHRKRKE